MAEYYSDAKFGVVTRKWFGLTTKRGGDVANSANLYTLATKDATVRAQLAAWYPKGPIRVVKVGSRVIATLVNASVDRVPVRFKTRGASASLIVRINSAKTLLSIASANTGFTVSQCKAGEYLSITTGTPQTDKGTAANTATTTGTLAFFVDYVPTYDSIGTHDS